MNNKRFMPDTHDNIDPYIWLEEIQGEDAVRWVGGQNGYTLDKYGDDVWKKEAETLTALLDRPDNLPHIRRRGEFIYNYWTDEANPRGLWRRTSMASFKNEAPDWDVVIDLDALADAEGEDWIWHGANTLPGSHDRAMLRLSRGGSDAVVLREYDLEARAFVEGGFALPEAKGDVAWVDRDMLVVSSAYGDDKATTCGYSRTIRVWKRETEFADAEVLFETDAEHMGVWAGVIDETGGKRLGIWERTAFFKCRMWVSDFVSAPKQLDIPDDAIVALNERWAVVQLRTPWAVGEQTYAEDSVLVTGIDDYLSGKRELEVLFEPGERRVVQLVDTCGPYIALSILDDLAPVVEFWRYEDGWVKTEQPGIPQMATVDVARLDMEAEESDGDLVAIMQSSTMPPSQAILSPGKAPVVIKRGPEVFDASGIEIRRYEAESSDGEAIPYYEVGPDKRDGNAPVHMTGYGGFGLPSLLYYRASIGKLWLEQGGVSVVANLRGGGEFGNRWHEAGRREKKILSHDDFAAVARDLVRRGVTRPERIAGEGGSNGGLLIANMLTRYPEDFGALFCTIPLIDMLRYTKLLAGASWIDEYGDPEKPEDWAFMKTFSAYQNVEENKDYPPILIATTRLDDRVHPGHARKMAAKMQDMGHPAWFYEDAAGGHGYGKNNEDRAKFMALGLRFLKKGIEWD